MRFGGFQFLTHKRWEVDRPADSAIVLRANWMVFFAAIACLFTPSTSWGQATATSSPTVQAEGDRRRTKARLGTGQDRVPWCPPARSNAPFVARASAHHTEAKAPANDRGHHRVFLSWNASTPTQNDKAKDVGYCVYRRKLRSHEQNLVNNSVTQQDIDKLEVLTQKAIGATSCVDTAVEDGATYEYTARAVNRNGQPSKGWSNKATASIPPSDQPNSTPLPTPLPPSCATD